MAEKSIIMSLSVKPEMQALLKNSAKSMDWSVSELIRVLVEKCLPLVVHEGTEIPVILKIPASIKDNEAELKKWLESKSDAIVKKLTAPKNA